jgi:Na+/H+ antiporter NhaB
MAIHIPVLAAIGSAVIIAKTTFDVIVDDKPVGEALWNNTKGTLTLATQVATIGLIDPSGGFDFDDSGDYAGYHSSSDNDYT